MLLLTPCPPADPAVTFERWDWSQWASAAEPSGQGVCVATADLPHDEETVLLVPDAWLSWHRVTLPKVSSGRLRATLEGLLEEQVLDEPSQLHFAVAPETRTGRASHDSWVAACRKDWLQQAVQGLQAAGHHLSRIAPLATPRATALCAARHGPTGPCLTLMGPQGVLHLPLAETGPHAGSAHTLQASVLSPGEVTTAWAEPAVLMAAERWLPHNAWQPVNPVLLAHRLSDNGWNLAQGDLTLATSSRRDLQLRLALRSVWQAPAWRPLRWGLATLLLVQLLGLNLLAWRERQALRHQETQMRQLLTQTFPHITLVLDAPLQMQRELDRLRQTQGNVGQGSLEHLLQTLASVTPAPLATPQKIGFGPPQATLSGWPLPDAQGAAIEQALQTAGWQVQRQGDDWHLNLGAPR